MPLHQIMAYYYHFLATSGTILSEASKVRHSISKRSNQFYQVMENTTVYYSQTCMFNIFAPM